MTPLNNILFIDIETVSQHSSFEELSDPWQTLWTKKAEGLLKNIKDELTVAEIYDRAGIYAEFGKIICISCGIIQGSGENRVFSVKSFYGDDEKKLLGEFCEMLTKWSVGSQKYLCAHNGKEFDFPYLCRRMIINNECIPEILNISGKKPWEVCLLDTMELWRFGEYRSFISLNLLAHVLEVPTSKDDIDGSMVGRVYWNEKNLERIVTYCQKDVITMAQIYLRLNREPLLLPQNIITK
ncbi:MAG: ribonuclease H-like domain-containing protein [Chitinophagaceae bacterium]|nr:ribonuclease H-like domain-containing protein [Chitinophagaceae bacterium]